MRPAGRTKKNGQVFPARRLEYRPSAERSDGGEKLDACFRFDLFVCVRSGTRINHVTVITVLYPFSWAPVAMEPCFHVAFVHVCYRSMYLFRKSLQSRTLFGFGVDVKLSVLPAASAESPFGSSSLHPHVDFRAELLTWAVLPKGPDYSPSVSAVCDPPLRCVELDKIVTRTYSIVNGTWYDALTPCLPEPECRHALPGRRW